MANSDRIRFYRAPTRLHTTSSAFRGVDLRKLPGVEIFYAYTNAPGWVIDNAVEHGVHGIVMDGYGAGVINAHERAAVVHAQAKGVVVVMTSRVGSGKDPTDSRSGQLKDCVRG